MEIADHVEYLSIGEVLSELKTEFDEVSISKIRFLESQGLIEPERTKSGYRRFYPADVARLRWILRQQRDDFLPLKVIKARLDEVGDIDFEAAIAVQPNLWTGTEDDPNRVLREAEAAAEAAAASDAWEASHDAAAAASERIEIDADPAMARRSRQRSGKKKRRAPAVITDAAPVDPKRTAPSGAHGRPAADAEKSTSSETTVETRADETEIVGPDASLGAASVAAASVGAASFAVTDADASGRGVMPADPSPSGASAGVEDPAEPPHDPAAWLAALQEAPSESRSTRRQRERTPEPQQFALGRGLTFGRAEVLEVAGVSEQELDAMEEYGLVVPNVIGGERTYDASSMAVVKSVASFMAHGVEPRHLRMFKNAADREAGFYEQMVLPLLKQRNPRAAEQAVRTLSDLAVAGHELRRALVQQALRSHFGD